MRSRRRRCRCTRRSCSCRRSRRRSTSRSWSTSWRTSGSATASRRSAGRTCGSTRATPTTTSRCTPTSSSGPTRSRTGVTRTGAANQLRAQYGPVAKPTGNDIFTLFSDNVYSGGSLDAVRAAAGRRRGHVQRDRAHAGSTRYKDESVSTEQFIAHVNQVSHRNLTRFLRDWLYGDTVPPMPGHPDWTADPVTAAASRARARPRCRPRAASSSGCSSGDPDAGAAQWAPPPLGDVCSGSLVRTLASDREPVEGVERDDHGHAQDG